MTLHSKHRLHVCPIRQVPTLESWLQGGVSAGAPWKLQVPGCGVADNVMTLYLDPTYSLLTVCVGASPAPPNPARTSDKLKYKNREVLDNGKLWLSMTGINTLIFVLCSGPGNRRGSPVIYYVNDQWSYHPPDFNLFQIAPNQNCFNLKWDEIFVANDII